MGLSGEQRRTIWRGIFRDKRMKARVSVAFASLVFVWVAFCFSLFVFEMPEIAFAVGGVWLVVLLWALISLNFDSIFIVSTLYKDVLRKWKAFLGKIAGDDDEDEMQKTEPAKLLPETAVNTIVSKFEVIRRRAAEIDTRIGEIRPLIREVKGIAIDLASEWERMDKVYLLYLRGNDITSESITRKALELIRDLTEKTYHFAEQLDKLAESLNRIEAFELETEVSKELGTKPAISPEADTDFIRGMIGELKDWSECLTEAQEELNREDL